jgi:RNA polymerase sigma-70 factor (ECF subfamily)
MEDLIPTRATLIHRLKNWQDQSSWQDFFDTYWQLIYRVAIKRGLSESEAQDVVQETMVAVAKHMPGFKYDPKVGSFKAWLLNLTRWRITDQYRKRARYAESHAVLDENATGTSVIEKVPDETDHNLSTVWDSEWERNILSAALAKVKRKVDPQRFQMFDLYVNKQWPPGKVAEAFGVPVAQVYLAKHRVTDALREEVKRLEVNML